MNMHFAIPLIIAGLVFLGCKVQTPREIIQEVDGTGKITDRQAESLGAARVLSLNGLTSITDSQAERLSDAGNLGLNGLTSITDVQAKCFRKVRVLWLQGRGSITDEQAKCLSEAWCVYAPASVRNQIDKFKNQ